MGLLDRLRGGGGRKEGKREVAFSCQRGGLTIRARVALPEGPGPHTTLVWCHDYNDIDPTIPFERVVARGTAVCTFGFCGGATRSRSDGKTTDMSAVTEAADLEHVLAALRQLPQVDAGRVFLSGTGLGGMVALMVAMEQPDAVRGCVLYNPDFSAIDFQERALDGAAPERAFGWSGMRIGARYVTDLEGYDLWGHMRGYQRPVLIFHGEADGRCPISYSKRAVRELPHARLSTLRKTAHAIPSAAFDRLVNQTVAFVQGH